MVKLVEVNVADIPTERLGRRGRVSYPLIKSFMESNMRCAKLDLTGFAKNPAYLRSVLGSYINTHKLPIKLFAANGDLHMLRLDLDAKGAQIEWTPDEEGGPTDGNPGLKRDEEPIMLDSIEIERRFETEKHKTTK